MTIPGSLHNVVVGLVRRSWLVIAIVVIVCSAFAAHAVAALTGAKYLTTAPPGLRAPLATAAPAHTSGRVTPDGDGLVARDMFCSDCAVTIAPPDGPGGSNVPLSRAPAILIATSMGHDPYATVRVIPTDAQGSWGVGEHIPGVGVITEIAPIAIYIVDDLTGRRARLSLLDPAAAGRGTDAATSGAGSAAAPDEFAGRIRKIDDHTYEVDRELVRDLVTGVAKPGGARVLPMTDKGQVTGFRFLAIKDGSLPSAVGLKNGDILTSINNTPIHTAQQLLDIYADIDKMSGFEMTGTRGGKPLVLDLRLR